MNIIAALAAAWGLYSYLSLQHTMDTKLDNILRNQDNILEQLNKLEKMHETTHANIT